MRTFALIPIVTAALATFEARGAEQLLWFDAPARHFTESCPIGNGRLGAMVFGGVAEERIILNESGMWSGSPAENNRENAADALPEIRRLLLAGRNAEAEALVNETFTCAGAGSGRAGGAKLPFGSYQLLGNLRVSFPGQQDAAIAGYRRELDLASATATLSYEADGVRFEREAFASAPDEVIVVRLTVDQPGQLTFAARLDRPEYYSTTADGDDGLLMSGALPDGHGGTGTEYAALLRVAAEGGRVSVDGQNVHVTAADAALLFIAAAVKIDSFAGRAVTDPVATARDDLARAQAKSWSALREAHIAHYRGFYDRMALDLGGDASAVASLTTPQRLEAMADGADDPGLLALHFNFGRYLLIASSRPGGFPANLQGIWTDSVQTPWNGDWHLNINVQMNYWPAEVCNLSELHEPLFSLVASLAEAGPATARAYYDARGWVAHVLANPWGFTAPGESASWGATNTGSAWLCQHLWDHYLFTGDREFLAWAYPIMRGSAQFYLDMLIEEPTHGWLVTAPSNSPENAFRMEDGTIAHICMGPTIDQQLLRFLFGATREAAEILGRDEALQGELAAARDRLAPTRIGSDGRIMEWLREYEEPEPQHRHISHLWGLYPGLQISPSTTPELATAARATLERRGNGGTGWAIAHKMALWARLGDGDRALALLRRLLLPAGESNRSNDGGGGTYPNLFDAHPPFQIDGNFGATAAIAEMLVQSTAATDSADGVPEVHVLPAVPATWTDGAVTGLRARDGFEVAVRWKDGLLSRVSLRAEKSGPVRVRWSGKQATIELEQNGFRELSARDFD